MLVTIGNLSAYQKCVCGGKEVTKYDSNILWLNPPLRSLLYIPMARRIPNLRLRLGGREGWRDAEERGEGMGWRAKERWWWWWGGGAQQLAAFFFFFLLSLSLVAVSVSPI